MSKQLRAEARPADWKDLDLTQKDSFRSIVKMIGEGIDQLSISSAAPNEKREPFQLLDSSSSSRTVFLSGDRGTGKTTVMLSVIKASLLDSSEEIDDKDKEFKTALENMRRRVVWLETLDMETTPSSANLLAAILARVEDSVRRLGGLDPSAADLESEFLGESKGSQGALLELQQLQRKVILAWDSNLSARGGQLDPDVFAIETSRGEQARLSLAKEMEGALTQVSTHCFRGFGLKSPLFVLPVDDIDLNPQACLHLLRLLRLISVPHLFTLILGDEKVAELVLHLKMSSELARIAGDIRIAEQLAFPASEIGARAADIAVNAFRKLLPPAQRVHLSVMDLQEAFNYCPLNCSQADPRLFQLMEKCPVTMTVPILPERWPSHCSLLDVLLARGVDAKPAELSPEEIIESPYATGIGFLRVTPRKLADLWLVLKREVVELQHDPAEAARHLVDIMARLSSRSLQGDPKVPQQDRELIPMAIARDPKGDWEFGRLPIQVVFTTDVRQTIEVPLVAAGGPEKAGETADVPTPTGDATLRLVFAKDRLRSFEALNRETPPGLGGTPPKSARRRLEPAVTAELALFHDLLAFRAPAGQFLSPLLPPQLDGLHWASAEWHHGEIGLAYIDWPAPPLRTFWAYDRFLDEWNKVLNLTLTRGSEAAGDLVFAWISLGTAAMDNKPPVAFTTKVGTQSWTELGKRLAAVQTAAAPGAASGIDEWLINVGLLLMPECGLAWLPGLEANLARIAKGISEFWLRRENVRLLRRLRAMRLAQLVGKDMGALAEWLRATISRARPNDPLAVLRKRSAPSLELIVQFAGLASAGTSVRKRRNQKPGSSAGPAEQKAGPPPEPKPPAARTVSRSRSGKSPKTPN